MKQRGLPKYADRLDALHASLEAEFRAIVQSLPLDPSWRVLDAGCGDGFYATLLAERLDAEGELVIYDASPAFLATARERIAAGSPSVRVHVARGDVSRLPLPDGTLDLVWCAHSMQSFDHLDRVLRDLRRVLRPGGVLAVLETDNFHQLILPWPARLEAAVLVAEEQALQRRVSRAGLYFLRVAEQLLSDAGFVEVRRQTHAIDRQAPLDDAFRSYVGDYLEQLYARVKPLLAESARELAAELLCPDSPRFLANAPTFSATSIQGLVLARRPMEDS